MVYLPYLPTFTIKINQMEVNIPYMDGMGYAAIDYSSLTTLVSMFHLGISYKRALFQPRKNKSNKIST